MELTGEVGSLLRKKGGQVWSVDSTASVYDVVVVMAEKHIGALPVLENGKLVGIVSERDFPRKVILMEKSPRDTPVTDIMSSPVLSVSVSQTVEQCMQIVTDKRIRHLPVTEGDRIVGMISIGDLVNWVITHQRETIQHLEAYIGGSAG